MIARYFGLFAGAAILLGAAPAARATLTYDIRLKPGDPSNGFITYPGEVIELELFAQVVGSSAGVEGFQEGYGSVIATTSGGVTGGLSSTLALPFQSSGAQAGKAANLNSDTAMDLGSNQTVANTDFLYARASRIQTAGTAIANGMEFKLGSIFFTADNSAINIGSTVNISFAVTAFTGVTNIEALWMQDGAYKSTGAGGNAPLPSVGGGVTLTAAIPEPSSALLLGLGALAGCTARRRRPR